MGELASYDHDLLMCNIKTQFCLARMSYNDNLFDNDDIIGEYVHDLAYEDTLGKYDELPDSVFDNCRIIENISTKRGLQCLIVSFEQNGIKKYSVVFRGTESGCDWAHDLYTIKSKLKKGVYVHGGFFKQLQSESSIDRIVKVLKKHIHMNDTCYLTGHSLGAGLATITAYILANVFSNLNVHWNLVTFGSPRVGNKQFAIEVDSNPLITHLRVYDRLDPINYVPVYNYFHSGIKIQFCPSTRKWEIGTGIQNTATPSWYKRRRSYHLCSHYHDILDA